MKVNCLLLTFNLFQQRMRITIVNGPNLNLLGKREPEIYGNLSFEEFYKQLVANNEGVDFDYFQSNVEGELINKLQEVGYTSDGIILNAGGYTHTSIAIADVIKAISSPVVEVHLSNIWAREETIRHQSLLSKNCVGVISGFGLRSYQLALAYFLNQ